MLLSPPPVMPMRELPGRSGHLDAATAHAMRRHVKADGRPRPRRACLRDASPTTAAGAIIRRRRPRCRERAKPCTTDPNCSRKRDAWRAANASIAERHASNHGIAAGSAARFRAGDGRGTRHRPARAEPVDLLSCIASASRCLMPASCPARDARLAKRRHLAGRLTPRGIAPPSPPARRPGSARRRPPPSTAPPGPRSAGPSRRAA